MMSKDIKLINLHGKEIFPYIVDLARLRITVFKEYPYLYEGDLEYEKKYLQTYVDSSQSFMVIAEDNGKVIGASTAIPLSSESAQCQKPFLEKNFNVQEIFYLGESVLLPEYRGKGLYKYFFQEREAAARDYGSKIATFCGVKRAPDDSRQPKDYQPLDKIWEKFGYSKHSELCAYYEWKEIGETEASLKPLIFWLKNLC